MATSPYLELATGSYTIADDIIGESYDILTYSDATDYVPQILSTTFSPNQTHSTNITATIKIEYNYNTQVKGRVKVNGEYTTLLYSTLQNPYDDMLLEIPVSKLTIGMNTIIIEISGADGKIGTATYTDAIQLINTAPTLYIITAESDCFSIHATVADTDNDMITYKMSLINSKGTKILVPWTEFKIVPYDIRYKWDNSLVDIDADNIIRIEYGDNVGSYGVGDYHFTGSYKNIVFTDKRGKYISDDKGRKVNGLHLGSIVYGQSINPIPVTITNRNGTNLREMRVSIASSEVNNTQVELSKTNVPFNVQSELVFNNGYAHGDSETFYVRVISHKGFSTNGDIKIIAKGIK